MSPANAVSASDARQAARIFAALGDETRLRLVLRLSSTGPESIATLCAKASVSRQAITKHLGVLEKAGLAEGRRRGREHIWQLQPQRLAAVHECLNRISEQWDDALGRLKDFVEAQPGR